LFSRLLGKRGASQRTT